MKTFLILLALLPLLAYGQDTTAVAPVDTTIYSFADEVARFPSPCERYDTTAAAKWQCAQNYLLEYIYQRALYPAEAREQGISGTAVVAFIVERNGLINRPEILRDPGGGLGLSALRSVIGMQREVLWRPAFKDGAPVRYRVVLPVRFRLEEPKPYVIIDRDTVYTELTKGATFTGNDGNLAGYLNEKITYPDIDQDSCATGQMDMQLIIQPNGLVAVNDIIDYNDLGVAFTAKAIDAATGSFGKWIAAEYEGRKVASAYDVSFTFAPTDPGCQYLVQDYNTALATMQEAQLLVRDSSSLTAGLAKMDSVVESFPRDGRFRILRGQTLLDNNRLAEACQDLTLAREIALIDWYDSVLPLICRPEEDEE
ncbi:energy transducer TonB [Lewinella sp. JB7]|uniref:energy transducer TonB n=1 Tax=Lewinella sp. JB7 TaxID=2962887 RepID=UPI0020C9690C|nr:energy transducer TonB [Lewinella sp. JB7]MCP9235794.1 energy transducer TonB [Lewinella sp. JB7]